VIVLVADPDPAVRELAVQALTEFGYRSIVAGTADELQRTIVEQAPDVIVVSASLDDVDLASVCRLAREQTAAGSRYLVVLVEPTDAETLRAAMLGGADDFLVRPLVAEQLHARLQVAERFALLSRQLRDQRLELDRAGRALQLTARTDTLTQLGNQRQLDEDLALFDGQLQRYGHRYVAAAFELDNLPGYIDLYGQLAADEALRVLAETVLQNLRSGDRAYRCESAEVVLLLPEQTLESARVAVERIRAALAALAIPHAGNPPWDILTLSAGIAAPRQAGGDDAPAHQRLLGRAEAALEQARQRGGNQAAVAGDETGQPATGSA